MALVDACPEHEVLERLMLGRLAGPAGERLAQHLESCDRCAALAQELAPHDPLVEAAHAGSTVAGAAESATVRRLLERLHRLGPPLPQEGPTTSGETPPAEEAGSTDPVHYDFLAPPAGPDEVGRLGRYRILKPLGAGGMGIVFQAEDPRLKRTVALKVLKREAAGKPSARARFLREAQAAAGLEHEHIVTVYEVNDEGGVPYLAMQCLAGMSLEEWLRRCGPLNVPQVLRLGRQIARGLAAAHAHGVIHRDIKPANLWLEARDEGRGTQNEPTPTNDSSLAPCPSPLALHVKILDFGLARADEDEEHLTQSGAIVGTPAYMAPEQARGAPIDARSDLFSLGVVLYRLTTGRLPFRGNNTMAVLTSLATDQPEPPRSLMGDLPVDLSDLILELLAKDPAQRPASARAVADRLQAIGNLLGAARVEAEQTEQLAPATAARGPEGPEAALATWSLPPALLPCKAGRKRPLAIAVALGAMGALGALALLIAGAVFFLQTPSGTVRIEINDDKIEAILTKNGAVIKGADEAHDIIVGSGEQSLQIKRGDLEFETDQFVLKKGETIRLKIELLPGKIQVVQGGRVIGEKALPILVASNDRKAAEWALSLGGAVTIDDGKDRTLGAAKDLPAGPWTLRQIHLFENRNVDDAGLKQLTGLRGLRWLDLRDTQVTDAGLKELGRMKSLEFLSLNGTKVTEAGLLHLHGLAGLITLNLTKTAVTAQGIAALRKALPGCQILSDVAPVLAGNDRKAAEWVLSVGGTVIVDDGKEYVVGPGKNLPGGPWTMRHINVTEKKQVDDASLKHLAGLEGLRSLILDCTQVTDAGLKELANLKSLTWLTLAGTKVSDAGLKHLAGLHTLEKLDLTSTQVTEKGLKGLAVLKNLKKLTLTQTNVTAAGVAELNKALPGCQITSDLTPAADGNDRKAVEWVLSLGGTMTIDDGKERVVKAVTDLPAGPWTMRHVILTNNQQVDDAGLKVLAGLKRLNALDLHATQLTDTGVKELAGLKSLTWLSLYGTNVTDTGVKELAGLKNLRMLNLHSTKVTDAGLKALAGLQSLQSLVLHGTTVTDAGLKDLAVLQSLQSLALGQTQVTDAGLKDLAGLKGLQSLHLGATSVTDAGLKDLTGLEGLQTLVLGGTKVMGPGLRDLAGLKSLQTLALNSTPVTDAGLKDLAGLKSLQTLNLTSTAVTNAGLKELAGLENLLRLDLIDTKVTDAGLKELAGLKNLQMLFLNETNVTDAGLAHLQGLTKLKTLDLTKTAVTAQGIAALRKALPGCLITSDVPAIATTGDRRVAEWVLSLGGSVTIADGKQRTISTAKDLPAGPWTLRGIDLSDKKQVDDMGLKLVAGLKSLQSLDLGATKVTDAGLKELAELRSLHTLSLSNTQVTDAGLKELAGLKNLQTLFLQGTKATDAAVSELRKALPALVIAR
jgi:Leucine-rich repeat (LRR) protein